MRRMARSTSGSRVVFARAADGVGQVGEQGEVKVGIGIGETADLEVLHQLADLALVQQQRGDGDQVV